MSTLTVACSRRLIKSCGRDDTIKPQRGSSFLFNMSAIKPFLCNTLGYSSYPSKRKARPSPLLSKKYLLQAEAILAPSLSRLQNKWKRSSIHNISCTVGSRKHTRRTNLKFDKIFFLPQRYAISFNKKDFPMPGAPLIKMNWGSLLVSSGANISESSFVILLVSSTSCND